MTRFEKFIIAFISISTISWFTFALCFIAFSKWFKIDILEFVEITGIALLISWAIIFFSYLVYEIWVSEQISKFKEFYLEVKEYNESKRQQKSKELFEPEQSTNIYHEILDEDLENDLNRSWAHYESKRK